MQGRRNIAIGDEYFQTISDIQRHRCGICFERKPLVPDHNHKTGRVRGLLCSDCNMDEGRIAARADATGRPIAANMARWTDEDGWPDLDEELGERLHMESQPSRMHARRRKTVVVSSEI